MEGPKVMIMVIKAKYHWGGITHLPKQITLYFPILFPLNTFDTFFCRFTMTSSSASSSCCSRTAKLSALSLFTKAFDFMGTLFSEELM